MKTYLQNRPAFYVVSADRYNVESATNVRNRVRFEAMARFAGLPYKRAPGMFEATREESYVIVPRTDQADHDRHALYGLARYFDQAAILYVDPDRYAWRIDTDGPTIESATSTYLGRWIDLGTDRPNDAVGWTYDTATGHYWSTAPAIAPAMSHDAYSGRATHYATRKQAV